VACYSHIHDSNHIKSVENIYIVDGDMTYSGCYSQRHDLVLVT
jgi:hypothetical protein